MTADFIQNNEDQQRSVPARMREYLSTHAFEAVALVLSIGAGLNYAVGRSYLEGWAEMAGIPALMFRMDLYDTILAGAQLESVWRTAALTIVFGILYLWANVVIPDWWNGRLSSIQRRRRRQDGCDHLGVRLRFATDARLLTKGLPLQERDQTPAWLRWKILGRRGTRRVAKSRSRQRGSNRLRPVSLALVLAVIIALIASCVYVGVKFALLTPAATDGAQQYAKLYVAVTGHFPYQYEGATISARRLKTWACEGRAMLSRYRSVELKPSEEGGQKDVFYVLQGFDSTFILLSQNGSAIRSFGDSSFSLHESRLRPLSGLARVCP